MAIRSAQEVDVIEGIREVHRGVANSLTNKRLKEVLKERKKNAEGGDVVDKIVFGEYEVEAIRRGLVKNPKKRSKTMTKRKSKAKENPLGWFEKKDAPAASTRPGRSSGTSRPRRARGLEMDRRQIVALLKEDVTDFAGADLAWNDLSGLNLRKVNFSGANLEGVNFENSNLRGANLTGANIKSAKFFKAEMDENTYGPSLDEAIGTPDFYRGKKLVVRGEEGPSDYRRDNPKGKRRNNPELTEVTRATNTGKYLQSYRVTGSGRFPVDMLRYDYSWVNPGQDYRGRELRTYTVFRYVSTKADRELPTDRRWESFGWTVSDVRYEKLDRPLKIQESFRIAQPVNIGDLGELRAWPKTGEDVELLSAGEGGVGLSRLTATNSDTLDSEVLPANFDGEIMELAPYSSYWGNPKGKRRLVAGGKVPKTLSKTMAKRKAKAKKNPRSSPPRKPRSRARATYAGNRWVDVSGDDTRFEKEFFGKTWFVKVEGIYRGDDTRDVMAYLRNRDVDEAMVYEVSYGIAGSHDKAKKHVFLYDVGATVGVESHILPQMDVIIDDLSVNPGRPPRVKNPCIGLHFHADDADKLMQAAEKATKRQLKNNPKAKAFLRKNPECEAFLVLTWQEPDGEELTEYYTDMDDARKDGVLGMSDYGWKWATIDRVEPKKDRSSGNHSSVRVWTPKATFGPGGTTFNPTKNPLITRKALRAKFPTMSDREVRRYHEQYSTMLETSADPIHSFGVKGLPGVKAVIRDTRAEIARRGLEPNPRKPKTLKGRAKRAEKKIESAAKRAGKRVKKDAKSAGKDVKKFAKTKTGYGALGAGAGALLLGPIGAIAGAVGGSKLHDNPGHPDSFPKHKHAWGFVGSEGTRPGVKEGQLFKCKECGMRGRSTDGGHTVRRVTPKERAGGPPKRRKNPSKRDHLAIADRKWDMFEDSWDSYTISNSPEDLLGAYTAAVEAGLHYTHAGVEEDAGRGYGPADVQASGIHELISERAGVKKR